MQTIANHSAWQSVVAEHVCQFAICIEPMVSLISAIRLDYIQAGHVRPAALHIVTCAHESRNFEVLLVCILSFWRAAA